MFGKTSGNQVQRLPSSVYWNGLGQWGIRLTPYSRDDYYLRVDETYRELSLAQHLEKIVKRSGEENSRRTS